MVTLAKTSSRVSVKGINYKVGMRGVEVEAWLESRDWWITRQVC